MFSPQVTQHLTDWYTYTHVLHGILFYAFLSWWDPDLDVGKRLMIAVLLEESWEIIENTPYVIDYYRNNTMAVTFYGDTILNSLFDILAMMVGFGTARRSAIWMNTTLFLVFVGMLVFQIRDSLLLNVLMLTYPSDTRKALPMAPI